MLENLQEETKQDILQNVKNGKSYYSQAKKHNLHPNKIRKLCLKNNIQSQHTRMHNTDEEVIKAIKKYKVASVRDIQNELNYTSYRAAHNRLRRMVIKDKIFYTLLSPIKRSGRGKAKHLFDGYYNRAIYFVTKEDFKEWVQEKLPDQVSTHLRKSISHLINHIDVNVFEEEKKDG